MAKPVPVLIIGYGNALRGDDGAGLRAAALIAGRDEAGAADVARRVLAVHQLFPELADDLAQVDCVVFIDAYAADDEDAPLRVESIAAAGAAAAGSHAASPAGLLALCARLYARSPQACMVGIPAYDFAPGATISPHTARCIDAAVALCMAPGDER